jgi:hypothetical protein
VDVLRRQRRAWGRTRAAWRRNDGRIILLLIAIVFGVTAMAGIYGHLEQLRRSGTASVAIVERSFRPGRGIPDEVRQGNWLRYVYRVDGVFYTGTTFRPWTDVDARRPKVCYDPEYPSDHLLVDGRYQCGG